MSLEPRISVIMPTHNRRVSLLRALRAFAAQYDAAAPFELVVICDGDVDGSAAACEALRSTLPYPLQVLKQDNQGPAVARNRGIAAARAALILFFDDDQVPQPGLIAAHLRIHATTPRCATLGMVVPPSDQRLQLWCAWEQEMIGHNYAAMQRGLFAPTWRQFFTNNAAVRKQDLLEAGGFDPRFRRAEDVDLAWRLHLLGIRFVFVPQARGLHYSQRSYRAWSRIPGAYGDADITLARKNNPDILHTLASEFPERNRLTQRLVLHSAGRPLLMRAVRVLCGTVIRGADLLRWERAGFPACSLFYNLEYYHAVAVALGGRAALLSVLSPRREAAEGAALLSTSAALGDPTGTAER